MYVFKGMSPLWLKGMVVASGWYCVMSRKLETPQGQTQTRGSKPKVGTGHELSEPTPGDHGPPAGRVTSSNNTTKWGPSAQIPEPGGDISHPNTKLQREKRESCRWDGGCQAADLQIANYGGLCYYAVGSSVITKGD